MVRLLYFPLKTFLGYGRNPLSTSSDRSCHNSDLRAPLMRGFILRVSCIDLGGPEGCAAGQSGVVMHALQGGGCVRLHAPPAMVPVLGAWSSPLAMAMAGAFKIVPPRPGTITRRLQVFQRSGDAFRYSAIESGLRSSLPSI